MRVRILGLHPQVHAGGAGGLPIGRYRPGIAEMGFYDLSVLAKVIVRIITAPPSQQCKSNRQGKTDSALATSTQKLLAALLAIDRTPISKTGLRHSATVIVPVHTKMLTAISRGSLTHDRCSPIKGCLCRPLSP